MKFIAIRPLALLAGLLAGGLYRIDSAEYRGGPYDGSDAGAAGMGLYDLSVNNASGTNHLGTQNQGPFVTAVAGLSPETLYYYRCYGTNLYGKGWSDTAAFTTRIGGMSYAGGEHDGYGFTLVQTTIKQTVDAMILMNH